MLGFIYTFNLYFIVDTFNAKNPSKNEKKKKVMKGLQIFMPW